MKKIKHTIENYVLQTDRKWKVMPVKRQRLFAKLFFAGYAILTVMVFIKTMISDGKKSNTMFISHIIPVSEHASDKKVTNNNPGNASDKN